MAKNMEPIEITEQNFEQEVMKTSEPVLVDFWAAWCGPCKMMGPIVEELAKDNAGKKVKIGKVNVDEHANLSSKFHILSIPTLIIFQGGKEVERFVGVQQKDVLQKKLDSLMA